MKRILYIIALITLASCSKTDNAGRLTGTPGKIIFAASGEKSVSESTVSSVVAGGFNVAAQIVTVDNRTNYFNEKATWSAENSWFETSEEYYYPADPVSFYAVHPADYAIEYLSHYTGPLPYVSYTQDGETDLIGAVKTDVSPSSEAVQLTFDHLLTQLKVACIGEDDKVDYNITRLEINIPTEGIFEFVGRAWSCSNRRTFSIAENTPVTIMPSYTTIRICWNCTQNGVVVATYDKSVSFTPGMGKICSVNCTLPNSAAKTIEFSVDVKAWDTEENNITMSSSRRAVKSQVSFDVQGVNTLDLCAFRADGSLDAYARQDGGRLTAMLSKNTDISYWLVSNAPEGLLDNKSTVDQFLQTKLNLADNKNGAFISTGYGRSQFHESSEKHLDLTRALCKISIGKITPSFLGNSLIAESGVSLDKVWIVNAAGSIPLSMEPSSSDILNEGHLDLSLPSVAAGFLTASPGLALTDASAKDLDLSFYCFPNPAGNTRLVLELTIAGRKNYYPITLPEMQCNYEYHASEVELLGFGSVSPDVPVDRKALRCAVTVNPWGHEERNYTIN